MKFKEKLEQMEACKDAVEWVGEKSLEEAWNTCNMGDWMLWFAYQKGVDIRLLTRVKVECAKLIRHLMKDKRSLRSLEVAEKFADGKATVDELYAAAIAASDAYAVSAYAAYAAQKEKTLSQCADICRQFLTNEILKNNDTRIIYC